MRRRLLCLTLPGILQAHARAVDTILERAGAAAPGDRRFEGLTRSTQACRHGVGRPDATGVFIRLHPTLSSASCTLPSALVGGILLHFARCIGATYWYVGCDQGWALCDRPVGPSNVIWRHTLDIQGGNPVALDLRHRLSAGLLPWVGVSGHGRAPACCGFVPTLTPTTVKVTWQPCAALPHHPRLRQLPFNQWQAAQGNQGGLIVWSSKRTKRETDMQATYRGMR